MAATALGNALTTKVERKDSNKKSRTLTGNGAEYRYTQKVGTVVSETLGSVDPADGTIVLREINFDPNPGGGYETVTLIYAPSSPMNWQSPPTGTIIYETDANAIEIPIQQHPSYDAGSSVFDEAGNLVTAALNPGGLKPGVTSYIVPQPTFTRTEVLSSFTFSEANIISNVGKRIAPTGMTSPTTSAWLKTRLSIRKNGNVVEKAESWQYASGLWDSDIYPAGT